MQLLDLFKPKKPKTNPGTYQYQVSEYFMDMHSL